MQECEWFLFPGPLIARRHEKSFQRKRVHSAQDCTHLAPWCRIVLNCFAVPVVCDFEAATIFFHNDTLRWPVPLERAYVRPASRTPVSVLSMASVVLTRTLISATQLNSSTTTHKCRSVSDSVCTHSATRASVCKPLCHIVPPSSPAHRPVLSLSLPYLHGNHIHNTHLSPLAQVKIPCPCILPLHHSPSKVSPLQRLTGGSLPFRSILSSLKPTP